MNRKRVLTSCLGLVVAVVVVPDLQAVSWQRSLQGGLVGGAVGALLSQSSHIDSDVAIPALAATGVLIGYGREQGWFDRSRTDRLDFREGWPYYTYAHRTAGYPYNHRSSYYRDRRQGRRLVGPRVGKRITSKLVQRHTQRHPTDRHPGVSLEHVEVMLPSGMAISVRLVKLNGRYIGPRGEVYMERPSGDTLLRRMEAPD